MGAGKSDRRIIHSNQSDDGYNDGEDEDSNGEASPARFQKKLLPTLSSSRTESSSPSRGATKNLKTWAPGRGGEDSVSVRGSRKASSRKNAFGPPERRLGRYEDPKGPPTT